MGKFLSFFGGILAGAGALAAVACAMTRLAEPEQEEAMALETGVFPAGNRTAAAAVNPDTVNA